MQLAIYKSSHEYTKALATIERLIGLFGNEGYAESYFYYIYKTPRGRLRSTRQLRARL